MALVEQNANMFLFEFDNSEKVRLAAVTDQLKNDIDQGRGKTNWKPEEFVEYLQDQGLMLTLDDLYDLYKNPPLNKVISNIQADKIVFKGQEEGTPENPDEQQSQQVVKQMAQSAMK